MENGGFKVKIPVTRYLFSEKKGDTIYDSGSNLSPVNLFMPKYIWGGTQPFQYFQKGYFKSHRWFSDVIINILIFIPLGILLHGMLRVRWGLTLKISLAALLAGTLFTLGVESMQLFSLTRNPSFIDVAMNMSGTSLGIAMDRGYNLFLNYRAERLQMLLHDQTE